MPPADAQTAVVSAPFSVTGTVWYSNDDTTRVVAYFGGGLATFYLTYEIEVDNWYAERAEFAFSRP